MDCLEKLKMPISVRSREMQRISYRIVRKLTAKILTGRAAVMQKVLISSTIILKVVSNLI